MTGPLEARALAFATAKHEGQTRKYTGEPYVTHCIAVANIVRTVPHTEEMIAAALLHDTVEDTDTSLEEIERFFGRAVAGYVAVLTDEPSGKGRPNREQRKAIDRERLSGGPPSVQTIKVADLIHNSRSIFEHDPSFARVYLREKEEMLDVLTRADPVLLAQARRQIEDGLERIF